MFLIDKLLTNVVQFLSAQILSPKIYTLATPQVSLFCPDKITEYVLNEETVLVFPPSIADPGEST